jgi:hypothetical protein
MLRQIPAQMPYVSYEDSNTQKKITGIVNGVSSDAHLQDPFRLGYVSDSFLDPFLDPSEDPRKIMERLWLDRALAEEEAEAIDKNTDVGDEICQVIKEYLQYTHKDDKLPLHPRR